MPIITIPLSCSIEKICQRIVIQAASHKLIFVQLPVIIDIQLLENPVRPLLSNLLCSAITIHSFIHPHLSNSL
jgi:hypothetical protein